MIVLDTNTLSETMKPVPSEVVLQWLGLQLATDVFITAVTQAEILFGIELLAIGKRRHRLASAAAGVFEQDFHGRILPFDNLAAALFAKISAHRRTSGRPISQSDAMIAAIAKSRDAVVATRNTRDFEHCGIPLVNPWIA